MDTPYPDAAGGDLIAEAAPCRAGIQVGGGGHEHLEVLTDEADEAGEVTGVVGSGEEAGGWIMSGDGGQGGQRR